jgi:hypothetical protein
MDLILPNASPLPGIDRNDSLEEWDIVNRLEEKQRQTCGPIDARISDLSGEFTVMIREYNRLKETIFNTKGWWASFKLRRQLKSLVEKMNINRDLRKVLYTERWRRT